jgi:serine/threonine-protein kinase
MGEPGGLTGVMGVGVQGLAEAPWLGLGTGEWRQHSATAPPANGAGTGSLDPSLSRAAPAASGFGSMGFGNGSSGQDGHSSRTLVVHREDGGRYLGGREPFLQRWLFSPRLAVVALILALGIGLGLGAWWLTSGRYASIPVVTDDSVSQARTALTTDGFTIAKVSAVPSNDVPKGAVVGTSPSGRAAKGSAITILVSSGPFTSVVPSVHGDTLAAAQAALQRVHLVPTVQRVGSDSPVGTVLGTRPAAGTTWPQTKPVTILVAGGLSVPNFSGQPVQVAEQWAAAHGANLQTQQDQNSQQPSGTITGQEPAAGSLYKHGETVVVTVSSGPAEINVPDVIGMSVRQATQTLEAAGFKAQVQSFGLGGGDNARVWDYSPVGQAPPGSVIFLDVLPGSGNGGGF